MAGPWHNLLSKTDRAIVAYIISGAAGTAADTYPAKRAGDKSAPDTVVHSESGTEAVTGNIGSYLITVSVNVRTVPEDGIEASETRVASTFDLFHVATLADDITTAARASSDSDLQEFSCDEATISSIEQSQDEGGAWVDTLNLSLICRPSA